MKEKNIVTQQVKCFVPIGRVGHFDDGDLMKLEPSVVMTARDEKGTFDETVSVEYSTYSTSSSGGEPETRASENESAAS